MGQKHPLCLSFSAEGGLDSGQGSSVFSSEPPNLGQLTMSYSCPQTSQPQTPYPATPSAAQQQQHSGYAQPSQPTVSAVNRLPQIATVSAGVLKIADHFEVSAARDLRVNEHDVCRVCEEAGHLFNWIF